MKQEEMLKEKYGTDAGYRVPDGYFEDLSKNIMSKLPPYSEKPRQVVLSRWNRVKPYVYLAAMFCGIWLMMRVFHNVTENPTLTLDNPPDALVHMIESESWDYEYESQSEPEFVLEEEVIGDYDSIEEFESDFGYSLKPEYSSLMSYTTIDA